MITVKIGNIFESNMDVLVNTVNCVGVMGRGIAKEYKAKFPKMYDEYRLLCENKKLTTGKVYPYYESDKVKILNFPTKQHWKSPSKLEYVIDGLNWFVSNYENLEIKSIAFPPLGCGNGGLDWETIGPIMYKTLKDLPIVIEIYAPFGTDKAKTTEEFLLSNSKSIMNSGIIHQPINSNWYLILRLVKCLQESEYSVKVGRTIFQKICYVLTRNGTDTGLNFTKGTYGPYSSDIKKMITILSNNNLIYEKEIGKMMLIYVNDSFKIDSSVYSKKEKDNVNNTFNLFKRIKDTEQAELITTLLFSYDQLKTKTSSVTEDLLYSYLIEWEKRYANELYENKIRELSKSLTSMKMIDIDYTHGFKNVDIY